MRNGATVRLKKDDLIYNIRPVLYIIWDLYLTAVGNSEPQLNDVLAMRGTAGALSLLNLYLIIDYILVTFWKEIVWLYLCHCPFKRCISVTRVFKNCVRRDKHVLSVKFSQHFFQKKISIKLFISRKKLVTITKIVRFVEERKPVTGRQWNVSADYNTAAANTRKRMCSKVFSHKSVSIYCNYLFCLTKSKRTRYFPNNRCIVVIWYVESSIS